MYPHEGKQEPNLKVASLVSAYTQVIELADTVLPNAVQDRLRIAGLDVEAPKRPSSKTPTQ